MPTPFKTRVIRNRFETTGWNAQEMATLSDGLIKDGIAPRIALARTIQDQAAPPLKPGYLRSKVRRGKKGIRNLDNTGQTKRALKTITAGANRAIIGFSTPLANKRIFINNAIVAQFGVSPNDNVVLSRKAGELPSPVKIVAKGRI